MRALGCGVGAYGSRREWSISSREIVPTEQGPGRAGRGSLVEVLPLIAADWQKENNESARSKLRATFAMTISSIRRRRFKRKDQAFDRPDENHGVPFLDLPRVSGPVFIKPPEPRAEI
jgi:hypothetical protein